MTGSTLVHDTSLQSPRFVALWHGMQRVHSMRLPFDVAINDSLRLNELRGRKQTERYMVGRVTAWQPDTKTATVVITTRASGRERSR